MQRQFIYLLGAVLLGSNAYLAYSIASDQSASQMAAFASELQRANEKIATYEAQIEALESRNLSMAHVLPSNVNADAFKFAKTFTFWVPTFDNPTRRTPDQFEAEARFHKWLGGQFGGWSRWKVEGGEATGTPETGWFYQVSVPKDQISVTSSRMKDEILKHFDQRSIYIVENRHH